jgi:DNA (cytosine-5)-methyltransferase 1
MTNLPVGIELFCGCGGASTGFLNAGFNIAAGFDIDRRSIEAYEYNHSYRGSRGFVVDLSRTSGNELLNLAGVRKIDVLLAGPPCQPFSIVGKRLGAEDNRARLLSDFVRLARELRPTTIFFENVPNLRSVDEGRLYARLERDLRRLGYSVNAAVVAAADFGVPQIRRRLLLLAARDGVELHLPERTHGEASLSEKELKPYLTVSEVLDDLPMAADFGECGVYNHEPIEHTAQMLERFSTLEPGRRERGSFHDRLHPERPSYTLRAGTGNFSPLRPVHYKFDRVITVRESARLQSFDDDFIWSDSIPRLQQYRQVGNAVPPLVASALARAIAQTFSWRLDARAMRGDSHSRPSPITLSDSERRARRFSRIRGASLGLAARRPKKIA